MRGLGHAASIAAAALALGAAGDAAACWCPVATPVERYAAAAHVLVARIESASVHRQTVVLRIPKGSAAWAALGDEASVEAEGTRATLRVTEALKGTPETLAFVTTVPLCEFGLEVGREYLLYVDADRRVSRCDSHEFNRMNWRHRFTVWRLRRFEGR